MSRLQSSGVVSGAISCCCCCCWSEYLLLHALPYLMCSKMHTFNKGVRCVALVSLAWCGGRCPVSHYDPLMMRCCSPIVWHLPSFFVLGWFWTNSDHHSWMRSRSGLVSSPHRQSLVWRRPFCEGLEEVGNGIQVTLTLILNPSLTHWKPHPIRLPARNMTRPQQTILVRKLFILELFENL